MSDKTFRVPKGDEVRLKIIGREPPPEKDDKGKDSKGPIDVPVDEDLYVLPQPGIFLYDLGKRWDGDGYTSILYDPQLGTRMSVPDAYYEYLAATALQGDPFSSTDGHPNCRPLPRAEWLYIDLDFYRLQVEEDGEFWQLAKRFCWAPPNKRPSLSGVGSFCPTTNAKPSISRVGAGLELHLRSFWHYLGFDTRDEMLIVTDSPAVPWDGISTAEVVLKPRIPLHIYLQPRRFIQTDDFNDIVPKKLYTADYIFWHNGEIPDYELPFPWRLDVDVYNATIAHYFARIANGTNWLAGTQFGPWDLVLQADFSNFHGVWNVGAIRQGNTIYYLWWTGDSTSRTISFSGHWKPPA